MCDVGRLHITATRPEVTHTSAARPSPPISHPRTGFHSFSVAVGVEVKVAATLAICSMAWLGLGLGLGFGLGLGLG